MFPRETFENFRVRRWLDHDWYKKKIKTKPCWYVKMLQSCVKFVCIQYLKFFERFSPPFSAYVVEECKIYIYILLHNYSLKRNNKYDIIENLRLCLYFWIIIAFPSHRDCWDWDMNIMNKQIFFRNFLVS